ncbi:Baculoviral IAP repeat-containing protein 3 [Bulinus truncatus]|nr:Baculoviral IAP repeat-containing protein 3 [Bulinus truncatus]
MVILKVKFIKLTFDTLLIYHTMNHGNKGSNGHEHNQENNERFMTHGNSRMNEQDEGYDIGPDEERLPLHTQENYGQPLVPIQMITGAHESADGSMIVDYEEVFVHRRPYGIIFEPEDETPSDQSSSSQHKREYKESVRLLSFKDKWLEEYFVTPEDLARNGFIFVGPGDRVKCVFCLNYLRGWEANDTVEEEHRSHFPDCPFVLGKVNHLNVPLPASKAQMMGLKVKNDKTNVNNDMSKVVNRIKTFAKAPSNLMSKKERFAAAGLYYTGIKDCLECFSCNRRLNNWEPKDDPFEEHAKFSPDCSYIQKVRQGQNNSSLSGEESFVSFSNAATSNVMKSPSLNQSAYAFGQSTETKHFSTPAQCSSPSKEYLNAALSSQQPSSYASQIHPGQYRSTVEYNASIPPQIVQDLRSTEVQAFLQITDGIEIEELIRLLQKIRIEKGSDYKINSTDLVNFSMETDYKIEDEDLMDSDKKT